MKRNVSINKITCQSLIRNHNNTKILQANCCDCVNIFMIDTHADLYIYIFLLQSLNLQRFMSGYIRIPGTLTDLRPQSQEYFVRKITAWSWRDWTVVRRSARSGSDNESLKQLGSRTARFVRSGRDNRKSKSIELPFRSITIRVGKAKTCFRLFILLASAARSCHPLSTPSKQHLDTNLFNCCTVRFD